MTRNECEIRILALISEIAEVAEQYRPGMHLCMSSSGDGHLSVFALDENEKHIINAVKFQDGGLQIGETYVR